MSQQEPPKTLRERVRAFDKPVLYSSGLNHNIWHVPQVKDGEVTAACKVDNKLGFKCTRLELFQRRRNARKCKKCSETTDGHTVIHND